MTENNNPALWRLLVLVDAASIRAVAINIADDSESETVNVALDTTTATPIEAVRDAVYTAPMLTADYRKVDILYDTHHYMVVPSALSDSAIAEAAAYGCLCDEGEELIIDRRGDVAVAWSIPTELKHFFARTFRNPGLCCRISPLLQFLSTYSGGNSGRVFVHIGAGNAPLVDIIAFGSDGSLRLCTTKTASSVNDITYWAVAALQEAGLDATADTIYLCGDTGWRMALTPELRRYAASVLPFIFPSAAMRGGHDAIKAPLPLILVPLCE